MSLYINMHVVVLTVEKMKLPNWKNHFK